MKYFSYIDHLKLTIADLTNFSPYTLKLVIDTLNKENIKDTTSILNGLEDSKLRSYHITIEKHIWLKELLLSNISELKNHDIKLITTHNEDDFDGFSNFLEPYLQPILPALINQLIAANALKLLLHILGQPYLFCENIKKDVISILKQKLRYADSELKTISAGQSYEHINYIKYYHFYTILNLYEPHFKLPLLKLYDTIIDKKSKFNNNALDPIFRFVTQAQVAFKRSQIDDVTSKLYIDNNAENAITDAYNESSVKVLKSSKSLLKIYALLGLVTVLLIAVLIFIFSLYKNYIHTENTNEPLDSSNSNKTKRTTYDNRIRFYYTLKRRTLKTKSDTTAFNETKLTPFSNPYPKTFNKLSNNSVPSENTKVLIENKSYEDLIIFKMVKGKDQSLYIPKDETTYIDLNPSDSLLFYVGDYFIKSEFSRFKNQVAISEIYNVITTENANSPKPAVITINGTDESTPFYRKVITEKHIETSENLEIQRVSIDNLYRNYYDKYAN
ncbi:MAG: hypothetical protein AB8B52_07065 [Winogradskyella sp.]|uniref:hypothetical protein n=1 Tax=Winogradskyella sp. TaxID=1883156 RepID=UPI00385CF6F6